MSQLAQQMKLDALRARMNPGASSSPASATKGSGTEVMPKADMKLITELGYSAVLRGWFADAQIIFQALETLAPNNAAGPIGFGLLALVQGKFDEAINILEDKSIKEKVSGAESKAILLLAYRLAGRNNDADILQREIESGGSHAAKGIAQLFASR